MVRQRVRIRFCKQGNLRWIGHRDLMRCLERLFRRAGLPLAMSEGFHPKPRMSFPSALAVGIEGLDEVMDLQLAESRTAEQLHAQLAPHAPPGLKFNSVEVLPPGAKKARLHGVRYRAPIPAERRTDVSERIARILAAKSHPIVRSGRAAPLDLRPLLDELELREDMLWMRLRETPGASPRPREVLAAVGLSDPEIRKAQLCRTEVEVR